MEITIGKVEVMPDGRQLVSFCARFGIGAGIWHGPEPRDGDTHQIELSLLDVVEIGRNAELHQGHGFTLSVATNTVSMTVLVERVDTDGVASLRLGTDCLFLAELAGPAVLAGQWLHVRLAVEELELYPYDSGSFTVIER